MTRLTLRLLGPLQVTCDGLPVTFAYDKVPALLAYLAVESGRPHSREALAELLWPDRPSATSRHSLSQALTELRRGVGALAGLTLSRDTVAYSQDSDCSLDVTDFTRLVDASDRHPHSGQQACAECAVRLEEATTIYAGDFLAHFSVGDSVAFEEWTLGRREALHRRMIAATAKLAGIYEMQGDLERAIKLGRRQLELEAWDETAHRQLMRRLALTGQRSAALAQYDRCRESLEAELNIEPEAETEALYRQIKAGELTPLALPPSIAPPTIPRDNLPAQTTAFIGRELEIAKLTAMLADPGCRLISLVGPGGMGKTRLSQEVARLQANNFARGVRFVALAPLTAPDLIPSAIAEVLDFTPYGADIFLNQLQGYLRDQQVLLVLDNFEHLLAGAAMLTAILENAPQVKFLVTSRARLNLRGEWVFDLDGLGVPASLEASNLEGYGAIQLFAESARRARAAFEIRDDDREQVIRICQLVSGMPLGIELAVAWLPTLSPEEIVREIGHNLDFLTSEHRDIPERHRSMRAVFDQSWRLLTESERVAFQRLAVFRGGFTRQAAEAVSKASLIDLSSLTSKSLLQRADSGRYAVHELLRQYGESQLHERSADELETRHRHSHYFMQFLSAREAPLKGSGHPAALVEIAEEMENIRTGWESAVRQPDVVLGLPAVDALWIFIEVRGRYSEGEILFRRTAEALKTTAEEAGDRALTLGRILVRQGSFYMRLGDPARSRETISQGLALLRPLHTPSEIAFSLNMLAAAAHIQGAYADERQFLQESIGLGLESGDRWITGYSLNDLGMALFIVGEAAEAKRLCGQALAIFTENGDQRGMAFALNNQGVMAGQSGDLGEADRLLREGLALWRLNDHRWGIATTLTRLGAVARARQDNRMGRAFFLEAVRTAVEIGALPSVLDALMELAAIMLEEGNPAQSRDIILAVLRHPACMATTRVKAERLSASLDLSPVSIAPDAETLIARLLNERAREAPLAV